MRDKLGWSYPPGMSSLPWEENTPLCEICLGNPEAETCLCPVCDICNEQGDAACYGKGTNTNHGLDLSSTLLPIIREREDTLRLTQEQELLAEAAAMETTRQHLNEP